VRCHDRRFAANGLFLLRSALEGILISTFEAMTSWLAPLKKDRLPGWTWVLPLVIFQLATFISGNFKTLSGSSVVYLTMAFGILMIHWWGPRVALALVISTWLNMVQRDIPFTGWNVFTSLRGPISILLSWLVFRKLWKGDCRLSSVNELISFIGLAIFLPITFNASFKFFQVMDDPERWIIFLSFWLPDILTNLAFTVPLMILVTPWLMARGWMVEAIDHKPISIPRYPGRWYELLFLILISMVLHIFLSFERFWFLFGVFSVYASVRFGLRIVGFFNSFIFFISYLLPVFTDEVEPYQMAKFYDIHLGMCLLFIFSLITARIMKDVRTVREQLADQNKLLAETNRDLQQANAELDRFVYSVSHDLSAPLKSIKGLVSLSKIENEPKALPGYLDKIGVSVNRLEDFIKEVLDYARSKRKEVHRERISISTMVEEILENIKYLDNYRNITVKTHWQVDQLVTDATRMKIILNNLITNAVKYHSVHLPNPTITLSSRQEGETVFIEVADNGLGIQPEIQEKIFTMFFRGAQDSSGSGLGLYIAREAAEKIQAQIRVQSEPGQGSVFTVMIQPFPGEK
jgi:two-component system, sensor histidine kinase